MLIRPKPQYISQAELIKILDSFRLEKLNISLRHLTRLNANCKNCVVFIIIWVSLFDSGNNNL